MTKKQITFNSLDSYFLNTYRNTLNIDYLRESIYTQIDVVWRNERGIKAEKSMLDDILTNKHRTIKSIVWAAFLDFTNSAIEQVYSSNYTATSEQLKSYLEKYGYTVKEAMLPVCKEIEQMRNNYLSEIA